MKNYLITSPAYRANGYNGTYYSIAFCNEDGDFISIEGDHSMLYPKYRNIKDIVGLEFSDEDRYITIKEVEVDIDVYREWEKERKKYIAIDKEWDEGRMKLTNNNVYEFMYTDKGKEKKDNIARYEEWIKANPRPKEVEYYGFLDCIL